MKNISRVETSICSETDKQDAEIAEKTQRSLRKSCAFNIQPPHTHPAFALSASRFFVSRWKLAILLIPLLLGGCVTMQPKEKAAEKAPVVDDATYSINAIARAEEAINQGKTTAAIYHYTTALQKSPESGVALRGLGNIYLGKNQPQIAERYFNEGVRIDADDAASQEGLGLAQLRQLNYLQAEEHLKLAVQLNKMLWRTWNGLGVIADFKAEHADAVAYYHRALEIVPGAPGIINNHGYSLLMAKKYPESEQQFRRGLKTAPNHQRLRNNLGITLAWQRRYDDAIKEIALVLPAAAALNNVGYIAMQLGDYEMAGGYFDEALKVSPTYYLPAAKNIKRLESIKKERSLKTVLDKR